tara:strand:- start:718 stop:1134 length:417 start_codon:yes stop_codon:yes gene_type:complete
MPYNKKELDKFKQTIIEGIAIGKSLKSILDNDKKLPSRPTVYTWLNEDSSKYDKEFFNNYVRAREDSADIDAEKIQELAENTLNGTYDPSAARIALDAYKWAAGKKKPTKYGDRQIQDVNIKSEQPLFPDVSTNDSSK